MSEPAADLPFTQPNPVAELVYDQQLRILQRHEHVERAFRGLMRGLVREARSLEYDKDRDG